MARILKSQNGPMGPKRPFSFYCAPAWQWTVQFMSRKKAFCLGNGQKRLVEHVCGTFCKMPPYGQVFCGSATTWVTRRQTVDALAQLANETLN